MKSMTGFGYAETTTADYTLAVEIKSYNSRYLEIDMNLPPALSKMEERIRRFIGEKAARGRVEIFVRFRDFSESVEVVVNKEAVTAHMKALAAIIETAGLNDQIHLAHLLRLEGIVKFSSADNTETYWPIVEPVLDDAFRRFEQSRNDEGACVKKAVLSLTDEFANVLERIRRQEPAYKERVTRFVKEKFAESLGSEVDEARVLQEIAVLLLKSDIHEEITRLEAHLFGMRETVAQDTAQGKRLDFFCQELNREINTIGAKSFVVDINNAVIDGKEIIERLRELLRNVE